MRKKSKKPGLVDAGHRPKTDALLRRHSTLSAVPSTHRIVRRFLEASAAAEVVRAATIRKQLRDLRRYYRESIARLDCIADEIEQFNPEVKP